MLKIEIEIGRPKLLLAWIVGVALFAWWVRWLNDDAPVVRAQAQAQQQSVQGGDGVDEAALVRGAENEARALRAGQALRAHPEELLPYQLSLLEAPRERGDDDDLRRSWEERRSELLALLADAREADRRLGETIAEIRAAQDDARSVSVRSGGRDMRVSFAWPVDPVYGISALFRDEAYRKRFGMSHEAIDIPVEQGTVIRAPADGVVARASDKGLGYSSLALSHGGGFATLYGHVSRFLVSEGDFVYARDPIAESGGTPGTAGAGWMTTGAHLHLEFLKDGEHVDPLKYLPPLSGLGRAD